MCLFWCLSEGYAIIIHYNFSSNFECILILMPPLRWTKVCGVDFYLKMFYALTELRWTILQLSRVVLRVNIMVSGRGLIYLDTFSKFFWSDFEKARILENNWRWRCSIIQMFYCCQAQSKSSPSPVQLELRLALSLIITTPTHPHPPTYPPPHPGK